MKSQDIISGRFVRLCACAALIGLALPLAAHPAADFLPASPGPVTLIAPEQLKNAPFLPDTKNNPLFLAYEEMQNKLEAKHIKLTVHALAKYDEGFLLHSTASPAIVRYVLKYKILGDDIAWTESGTADDPIFTLTIPDNGSFRITFPAKDWLLFAANRPPEPVDDTLSLATDAAKSAPTAKKEPSSHPVFSAELLKAVPDDAVLAYVWPEPGALPETPLMGELESLSFYIVHDEKDKRPVHAEIVMPAKTSDAALKIQKACRETIDRVYQEAAKLGKVPDELVNAFTVTRMDTEVAIHILLPDDMAQYFFTQFALTLQEEIRIFALPDDLK